MSPQLRTRERHRVDVMRKSDTPIRCGLFSCEPDFVQPALDQDVYAVRVVAVMPAANRDAAAWIWWMRVLGMTKRTSPPTSLPLMRSVTPASSTANT